MILKKKKNYLYLKLERNELESFGNNSQGLFFSSDLIIDLLAYEVIEPSFLSLLCALYPRDWFPCLLVSWQPSESLLVFLFDWHLSLQLFVFISLSLFLLLLCFTLLVRKLA